MCLSGTFRFQDSFSLLSIWYSLFVLLLFLTSAYLILIILGINILLCEYTQNISVKPIVSISWYLAYLNILPHSTLSICYHLLYLLVLTKLKRVNRFDNCYSNILIHYPHTETETLKSQIQIQSNSGIVNLLQLIDFCGQVHVLVKMYTKLSWAFLHKEYPICTVCNWNDNNYL